MTVVPDEHTTSTVAAPMKTRHRIVAIAVAVVFVAIAVFEVRFYVVPSSNRRGPTDAVVVLGGGTFIDRLRAAGALLQQYPGAVEVVSTPGRQGCPYPYPGASDIICFRPNPATTQGEARATAALAAQYGWKHITVVTTADQVWRARLRFSRCWSGDLSVVRAPTSIATRLFSAPYETAATIKAEVFQRGC
ncbi:MAG TPA: hypothetical protein VGD55_13250 [Acidothermaceae bacterium]